MPPNWVACVREAKVVRTSSSRHQREHNPSDRRSRIYWKTLSWKSRKLVTAFATTASSSRKRHFLRSATTILVTWGIKLPLAMKSVMFQSTTSIHRTKPQCLSWSTKILFRAATQRTWLFARTQPRVCFQTYTGARLLITSACVSSAPSVSPHSTKRTSRAVVQARTGSATFVWEFASVLDAAAKMLWRTWRPSWFLWVVI